MAFLFKFLACCHNSKNIENEKEGQEFRLSSPRFPQPDNLRSGSQNFAIAPQGHSKVDGPNDQTFNQGDDSVNMDGGNTNNDKHHACNANQISFEILKDYNIQLSNKEIREEVLTNHQRNDLLAKEFIISKEVYHPFQAEVSNSPRFESQNNNQYQSETKEFKKALTLSKNLSDGLEKKATLGGFIVMNKIQRSDEEEPRREGQVLRREFTTREALNEEAVIWPSAKTKWSKREGKVA